MSSENYLTYRKLETDRRYRIVYLTSSAVGEFQEFDSGKVTYPAQKSVLEILDASGETRIVYEAERDVVSLSVISQNEIAIAAHIPTQRLWVRPKNGKGICYKVPGALKVVENKTRIWIPAGVSKTELIGDRYFNAAYTLR